jgi:hypothetical protein
MIHRIFPLFKFFFRVKFPKSRSGMISMLKEMSLLQMKNLEEPVQEVSIIAKKHWSITIS